MLVKRIIIDYEKCNNSCKKCIEVCTMGTLEWFEGEPIVTEPSKCKECRKCEQICPKDAITIID
ncbi:MAG: 4Fe-4S dicluster domain-containing protein [Candidatus Lokiarchaeota archaeon]|nr:4Fe-4S dicluster domain-containing protein [Candidatus Lokiarchaeota archaeon]